MTSLTRPLCISIKGTHVLRGNPKGTHTELKGNPVTRLNSDPIWLLLMQTKQYEILLSHRIQVKPELCWQWLFQLIEPSSHLYTVEQGHNYFFVVGSVAVWLHFDQPLLRHCLIQLHHILVSKQPLYSLWTLISTDLYYIHYQLVFCVFFFSNSALYLRYRNKPDFFVCWDETEKNWLSTLGFIVSSSFHFQNLSLIPVTVVIGTITWLQNLFRRSAFLNDGRAHYYCASLVRTLYMTCRVPRHIFQARAPSRNWTKYGTEDLCGNLICEYFFFGCSVTPTIFRQLFSFSHSFYYTKKAKNLYVGSFNYFSYTIQIGSNWYMDTGVCDLEVACFKPNSTWINDIARKDLSNRPIYAVLNTHNLDMILQLEYMPIVMNPARIASSDWKS